MKHASIVFLIAVSATLAFGQKTDQKKLEVCQKSFKELTADQCTAFAQKHVWMGETKEQVLASLGKPKSQASVVTNGQTIESFAYLHGAGLWGVPGTSVNLVSVVFTDGKVTSIGGASAKDW
jgi:hypothetical protein